MKRLLIAGVVLASFLAPAAHAQTAVAGSQSQAASQSASLSGAQSNNQIIFPSTPATTRSTAEIETVPSVYAPSMSGGAHPCLAGGSGGVSVLGGGISGGLSKAEHVCMLAFLGQQEAAIRALASSSPSACAALNNVGYYVVPAGNGRQKVVPFKCEKQVKRGGAYTPNVATATVSTNSGAASVAYAKCNYDKASNKLTFKKKAGSSSAAAKAQCMASLGF